MFVSFRAESIVVLVKGAVFVLYFPCLYGFGLDRDGWGLVWGGERGYWLVVRRVEV